MKAAAPWIIGAALLFMFIIEPWLRSRGLLDGPRTIRHRPIRHVCFSCAAAWTPGHVCAPPLPELAARVELRRKGDA